MWWLIPTLISAYAAYLIYRQVARGSPSDPLSTMALLFALLWIIPAQLAWIVYLGVCLCLR